MAARGGGGERGHSGFRAALRPGTLNVPVPSQTASLVNTVSTRCATSLTFSDKWMLLAVSATTLWKPSRYSVRWPRLGGRRMNDKELAKGIRAAIKQGDVEKVIGLIGRD